MLGTAFWGLSDGVSHSRAPMAPEKEKNHAEDPAAR